MIRFIFRNIQFIICYGKIGALISPAQDHSLQGWIAVFHPWILHYDWKPQPFDVIETVLLSESVLAADTLNPFSNWESQSPCNFSLRLAKTYRFTVIGSDKSSRTKINENVVRCCTWGKSVSVMLRLNWIPDEWWLFSSLFFGTIRDFAFWFRFGDRSFIFLQIRSLWTKTFEDFLTHYQTRLLQTVTTHYRQTSKKTTMVGWMVPIQ